MVFFVSSFFFVFVFTSRWIERGLSFIAVREFRAQHRRGGGVHHRFYTYLHRDYEVTKVSLARVAAIQVALGLA